MHPYDGRVVSNFIRQALEGEDITIFGDGSQTRSFCYRDDLIEGIIRMMDGARRLSRPGEPRQPGGVHHSPVGRDGAGVDRGAVEAGPAAAAGGRSLAAPAGHHAGPGATGLAADVAVARGAEAGRSSGFARSTSRTTARPRRITDRTSTNYCPPGFTRRQPSHFSSLSMTTCPRLLDDSARRIRPAISGWPRSLTIPAAADQGVPLPPSPGKWTREKSRLAKPRTLTCTGQRRTSGCWARTTRSSSAKWPRKPRRVGWAGAGRGRGRPAPGSRPPSGRGRCRPLRTGPASGGPS